MGSRAEIVTREFSGIGSYPVHYSPSRRFLRVDGTNSELMQAITEIFNRILTPLYGSQDKALRQISESKDRSAYLLYEGDEPVAVLVFKTVLSNEFEEYGIKNSIEVKSLFVDQSQQNSGRGLGSALVDKLKEEVENLRLNHESIHVTVSETKKESLMFFKKKGFDIVHTWDGRYIPGVKEHLLSCPARAAEVRKVADILAERFASLMSGKAKAKSDAYAPELVHIIHDAHEGDIHGFIKLSDGTFVSGSKDNSMYKWNQRGERVRIVDEVEPTAQNERNWVTAMAVLNDEYWISGLRNGKICLWDTAGAYIRQVKMKLPSRHHVSHEFNTRRVTCLAAGLNPNKPSFFAGFPTMFDEFNLIAERTECVTKTSNNDWVYCIEPLTQNKLLSVTGCTVDLWEKRELQWVYKQNVVFEGKKRQITVGEQARNQRPFISSLKPLDTAKTQFALSLFDGSVRVLDLTSSKLVRTYREHHGRTWAVEPITPQLFASSGEDRKIKFWDRRAAKSVHTIADHIGQVTSMLKLSDKVLIAGTCPEDRADVGQKAEIRFYDIRR
ncbi:MAG: GNAT family N-acetyltransferase [Chlamydiales bacterium]|nr:GNAT family N-acetyltransferase [Chlamydiales bacterium]